MALLLAKGEDFASWRGVEEFSVAYREAAVRLAALRHPEAVPQLLEVIEDLVIAVGQENTEFISCVNDLETRLAGSVELVDVRGMLAQFYEQAYRHFARFGAPAAFFAMADRFLKALAATCLRLARQQIGTDLPPLALIAMGPAGRGEATRFCRIQLALVWEGNAEEPLMHQLGDELVAWLRVCGVALEENVTPADGGWRGSLPQWQARFEAAHASRDTLALIELLRFADRSVLVSEAGVAEAFATLCGGFLAKRSFIGNLVERCQALSGGITLMGGLKLNRSGPHRGAFSLLDHAFLPLAAAVASLSLMAGISCVGTPNRLRELVRLGRLDVDLAERTLHAWYCFSEHRLALEQQAAAGQDCRDILHLIPGSLGDELQERLRSSLETVADLQRYMMVVFGAYT